MARPRLPGWLLEAVGNGSPRGMITTSPRVTEVKDRTRLTDFFDHFYLVYGGTFPGPPLLLNMNRSEWITAWQACLTRVRRELTLLSADERLWLDQHVAEVVRLKQQLHRMFAAADGLTACAACDGACCARGQQHMTLVEVLTALLSEVELPRPEVDATCPFLTFQGCSLPPEVRPFNCVTFNCEQIEDRLDAEQQHIFYALEKELREIYAEFEKRYAGASLRGLVIRTERLGEGRLLARPSGER